MDILAYAAEGHTHPLYFHTNAGIRQKLLIKLLKPFFMERNIAGKNIAVNAEGFMTDFSQWDENVGAALAREANIELTI